MMVAATEKQAVYVNRVSKRFGSTEAVNGATFAVEKQSFTVILGPSGCGKTTLLRTIAGFYEPDEGEIYIGGKIVNTEPPHKRNTGLVFQNYALFPHMSVRENIGYGLKFKKLSKTESNERILKVGKTLGIENLLDRWPSQLSGGEQQRVAVARALVTEPQVLLLDEPLSNLDAKVRARVRTELKRLQRDLGITAIHVTHDQEEALVIGDSVVVMNKGRIVQIGPPYDIYYKPRTRFVADFIGTNNFLDAQITKSSATVLEAQTKSGFKLVLDRDQGLAINENERVVLSVRPESIKISKEQPRMAENVARGRVRDAIFLGTIIRYYVQINGLELITDVPGGEEVLQGEVYVALDRSKLHLVAD
jgi:ABC-type Fe3+/spermidine/putrescine transport system ATPase subunit